MIIKLDKHEILELLNSTFDRFNLIDVFSTYEDIDIFCDVFQHNLKDKLSKKYTDVFDYVYENMDIEGV